MRIVMRKDLEGGQGDGGMRRNGGNTNGRELHLDACSLGPSHGRSGLQRGGPLLTSVFEISFGM